VALSFRTSIAASTRSHQRDNADYDQATGYDDKRDKPKDQRTVDFAGRKVLHVSGEAREVPDRVERPRENCKDRKQKRDLDNRAGNYTDSPRCERYKKYRERDYRCEKAGTVSAATESRFSNAGENDDKNYGRRKSIDEEREAPPPKTSRNSGQQIGPPHEMPPAFPESFTESSQRRAPLFAPEIVRFQAVPSAMIPKVVNTRPRKSI